MCVIGCSSIVSPQYRYPFDLTGEILREVRGHTYTSPDISRVGYYMGKIYVRTLTLHKTFPYIDMNVNTCTGIILHVT